eukprot:evm.model.scf_818.9 EVM.evm.TU.scf_818.9   scf_818:56296-59538(-)
MTEFTSLPPICEKTSSASQENALARDVLEHAVLLSIKLEDEEAFERNFLQLQTYYTDQRELLPPSKNEYMIVGLNLVRLLVQNCTAEFHTELEMIAPKVQQQDVYIKHAIQLEQWLMEGAYNKVLRCKQNLTEYYSYFLDQLVTTMRDEIAGCCEKAYTQLKVSDAKDLMMFKSDKEVLAFAKEVSAHSSNCLQTTAPLLAFWNAEQRLRGTRCRGCTVAPEIATFSARTSPCHVAQC